MTTFRQRLVRFLLRELADALQTVWPPPRPSTPSVRLLSEEGTMLRYQPILPAPGAPDVIRRELTISRDGVEEVITFDHPGDVPTFTADQGAAVIITLVDIDDASPPNRSEPSPPHSFTASDTIAPAAPGDLTVELVGEE